MSDSFDFEKFFPYPSVRPEQRKAINFALDAFFNKGKRFVIIEAGTGTGKSGIGVGISRFIYNKMTHGSISELDKLVKGIKEDSSSSRGTWFLTTQKILQDQYTNDFGPPAGWMSSVKSSSNYACKIKRGKTCAESRELAQGESDESSRLRRVCGKGNGCTYTDAREYWKSARESVTNFPYFMTFGNYAEGVVKRDLLVIDEAHNIEGELSKFIDVTVSENFAKRVLKLNMPDLRTQFQAVKWIRDTYFPKVSSHMAHINKMLESYKGLSKNIDKFASLSRQIKILDGHHKKVEKFLDVYDKDNWVMNVVEPYGQAGRKLEFKVIDVSHFSDENLFKFGNKILLMSATILNKDAFCESLGIPKDDAAFIEIPTPFPVKNRPIITSPVGKMSRNSVNETLPKMARAIEAILEAHKGEKGIIHTHTFKNAKYFMNAVNSDRLLTHSSIDRESVLKRHIKSKKASVLLSPSMTEGVDLKGENSRFQIICKIPYPYLGDPLTKKRMNKWDWWYSLQTAKTIVQSVGRSVRSIDDYAVTYILDADWGYFYARNSGMFPSAFKESLS